MKKKITLVPLYATSLESVFCSLSSFNFLLESNIFSNVGGSSLINVCCAHCRAEKLALSN